METCGYKQVNKNANGNENISRKCFLRQMLVCSVVWMGFFIFGLCLGSPTVLIAQIRKEANSTVFSVSGEMEMWLSATLGYGSIPWVVIITIATEFFGRKIPLIIICLSTFIAVLIFYLSSTVTEILISEAMECINGGALTTILIMMLTEYTSHEYRGFFITFKSATFFWGIWVSNAIGTFFHWKYIGLVKLVCSIYPIFVVLFIPESPYWLASKGEFDKCAESHRWLKGEHSEMELERLISTQKAYIAAKMSKTFFLTRTVRVVLSKEFCKPTLMAILLFVLYYCSGKLSVTFYFLDVIKRMTTSEQAAYVGMLILDGVTVLGMYVGTALTKCLNRKPLLLVSSALGVLFLFISSLYMYLVRISYIVENNIVSLTLLICYSLGICFGPMLLSPAISNEILPLRNRGLSLFLIAGFDNILFGVTIQLLPFTLQRFGLDGTFFFFGLSSTICIVLLYKYLPETKGKTLQEIADLMIGIKRDSEYEATELKSYDLTRECK